MARQRTARSGLESLIDTAKKVQTLGSSQLTINLRNSGSLCIRADDLWVLARFINGGDVCLACLTEDIVRHNPVVPTLSTVSAKVDVDFSTHYRFSKFSVDLSALPVFCYPLPENQVRITASQRQGRIHEDSIPRQITIAHVPNPVLSVNRK